MYYINSFNSGKVVSIRYEDGYLSNIGKKLIKNYMGTFLNKSQEDKESIKELKIGKQEILVDQGQNGDLGKGKIFKRYR